jgi:hypothetical protein
MHLHLRCICIAATRHTLPSMWAKRTRRWHISESTSRGVWNRDVTLAPRTGCGQTRGEVLQGRSSKDGFKKRRFGRESDHGAAQGYMRSA